MPSAASCAPTWCERATTRTSSGFSSEAAKPSMLRPSLLSKVTATTGMVGTAPRDAPFEIALVASPISGPPPLGAVGLRGHDVLDRRAGAAGDVLGEGQIVGVEPATGLVGVGERERADRL